MSEKYQGLFLAALGLYCLLAFTLNWEFFYDNYKTRYVVSLLGRTGARRMYLVTGIVMVVGALTMIFKS